MSRVAVLSGSALKWIALISMTIDHIGMLLFPSVVWMRVVGRLAFPIFAHMIAEGCFYTRSRLRYFLTLLAVAVPIQITMAIAAQTASQCIMVTFALSVLFIMLYEWARSNDSTKRYLLLMCAAAVLIGGTLLLQKRWATWHFALDYTAFGVLLPLLIYIGRTRWQKLALCAIGLVPICLLASVVQWWCFLALIPLALYNGTRGKHPMKYLFYIYYPLHLAALYGIDLLL